MRLFVHWCESHGVSPGDPCELDDLLVEWKNSGTVSKAQFQTALAAAELAIPSAKGHLTWARSVCTDWEVIAPVAHHAPLPKELAILIGVIMSACGFGRLGAGLIIQQRRGLRPSELLRLRAQDIMLPEDLAFGNLHGLLNLGMKHGTKAKRPQAVLLDAGKHSLALMLARMLKESTAPDQEIMGGVSLQTFQRIMAKACTILRIAIFTPHCARSGFATDAFLDGDDFTKIREEGRWISDSSLRIYLDAVSSATEASSGIVKHYAPLIKELIQNFIFYFSWWPGARLKQSRPLPLALRVLLPVSHSARPSFCPSLIKCPIPSHPKAHEK